MYGLHGINHMYSEFAGQRSDFIIMGHPEFCFGKQKCQRLGPAWDQTKRVKPARSVKGPSPDIGTPGLYMRPLKERARARSEPKLKDTPACFTSVDGFLAALDEDSGHPLQTANSLSAPATPINAPTWATEDSHRRIVETASDNHMNSVTLRHYKKLRSDLSDIKERWKANPEKTKQELTKSGAWRYYAQMLEKKPRSNSAGRNHRSQEKWLTHHNTLPGIGPGCLC